MVDMGFIRPRPEVFWLITPSTRTPHQTPVYWLRNYGQIVDEAITPVLSLMWTGEANAQQAMDQAVQEGKKLLQGGLFEE